MRQIQFMKLSGVLVMAWLLLASSPSYAGDVTTVYLVRHAEKELDAGKDPALTAAGQARAERLVRLLAEVEIAAIYSTDYTRTRDTAAPLAAKLGQEIVLYSPRELPREMLLEAHAGKSVLVVGHSNTVPALVNAMLGEERFAELDESIYDTLFIVDLRDEKTTAQKLHLD